MVADDEILFRRVPFRGPGYSPREGELPRISSQAFNDKFSRTSFDRKSVCKHSSLTQGDPENGVVRLTAAQIRGIGTITQPAKQGQNPTVYKFDVVEKPVDGNEAHAEVHPSPDYSSKEHFKKLKEALARLADWDILPADARAAVG